MKKTRGKVLIANRGEIAIRIAKTCQALGFQTVGLYSDADRFAEHVCVCQEAYALGGTSPQESYLNVKRIIEVAQQAGVRFVHPGYGFLSERAHFVDACEKAGLVFVGPTVQSMLQMGDKIQARKTVDTLNIPRVPGSAGVVKTAKEALAIAEKIGWPILLKAAAGGGGKGMRRVDGEQEMRDAFEGASREALSAFGESALYLEKFILEPHHVEIQVFGDGKGGAIHLGERECSIQRRHQKVWEETPSPLLEKFTQTRELMFAAALKITSHVKYAGAGTLEFIVDAQGRFYFLEMNTRLQVEHPVTEWVTGVDLVAWQLLLAAKELAFPPIPARKGHAIEVRLYAEDSSTFLPAPGPLGLIHLPTGAFVRSDSAFHSAGDVSIYYDPMISKISVWASTRESAIDRLRVALDEVRVESPKRQKGIRVGALETNLTFLRKLVRHQDVLAGQTTTDLIARNSELTEQSNETLTQEAAVALSLFQLIEESEGSAELTRNLKSEISGDSWKQQAYLEGLRS